MADIREHLMDFIRGEISTENLKILNEMLSESRNEQEFTSVLKEIAESTPADPDYKETDWHEIVRSIIEQRPVIRRIPFYKKKWVRAAAAILIFGLSIVGYFILKTPVSKEIAQTSADSLKNDIAPGGNKAILTLGNGSKIILDSAANGTLALQGNTKVIKTGTGKLSYESTSEKPTDISFNTLSTPRGGIFAVTLPDGSTAWLNVASSITYPTRFEGTRREVKITGELYFEVAHDVSHPFVVSVPSTINHQSSIEKWMQIEVLGTRFNINSYEDDPGYPARTTLLEGSVKISAHGISRIISPNEQAVVSFSNNDVSITKNVDIEKVMAWKNGEMIMTNTDTRQLMREISRWYDVDVEFKGDVPNRQFYGSVNRNVPLSSVLHVLKAYGIETKLENKKLIVEQ